MGFNLSQVLSDGNHYKPFVCSLCEELCSIDAVVTRCSHPFCRSCLQAHVQSNVYCPCCQTNLSLNQQQQQQEEGETGSCLGLGRMSLGETTVCCKVLKTSQPLAFQVLAQIQVACINLTEKRHCDWTGCYGEFANHALTHPDGATTAPVVSKESSRLAVPSPGGKSLAVGGKSLSIKSPRLVSPPISPLMKLKLMNLRPALAGLRSLSDPSLSMSDKQKLVAMEECGEEDDCDGDDSVLLSPLKPAAKSVGQNLAPVMGSISLLALKAHQSLSSLSDCKGDEDAVYDLVEHDYKPTRPRVTPEVFRKSLSLSDVRKNMDSQNSFLFNSSIASPPPDNRKSSTPVREAPPRMVQRTVSDDGSLVKQADRKFAKHSDSPKKRRKKQNKDLSECNDTELDESYSQALDWNMSINSFGAWNNDSYSEEPTTRMETLTEESDVEYDLQFEPDSTEETKKIFEKAERLKKQANAKFNKGDFAASRTLYTEGIAVMSAVKAISLEERELLSNMYSNRAVTFFREKKFENCIEDCDKALVFVPSYDKSWIRKWRALTALGNVQAAHECLETAAKTVPNSQRIQEELGICQGDQTLLQEADKLLQEGDYQGAREILKPYSRNTENIGIMLISARADAGLGFTESALEKVNKALRFNPTHNEALEIRGHTLFLTGETEKGAHLLQEAYVRNKDNRTVRTDLIRCQKTHSAVTKGRSCVKRGRYFEAVDHFSAAIKESGEIPPKAPLFGILRTERAEAFLLSKSYAEALRDCDDVLNSQSENASAYSVRAEILISLGKADEAKKELERIRSTWGCDNPTIAEAYRRVDFELRVLKADGDLMNFVEDLKNGNFDFSEKPRSPSRRKLMVRKSKSRRSLDGEASPVNDKDCSKAKRGRMKDERVPSSDRARRRSCTRSSEKGEQANGRLETMAKNGVTREEQLKSPSKESRSKRPGLEQGGQSSERFLGDRRRPGFEKQGMSERFLGGRRRPGLENQGMSERFLGDRRRPSLEKQGMSERALGDRRRPCLDKHEMSERELVDRRHLALTKQKSRRSNSDGRKLKMVETIVTS